MGLLFNRGTRLVRAFQPPPTPPPQRVLSGGEVDEQKESVFLSRLPSEIRNEIYCLVFGTPTEIEDEGKRMEHEDDGEDEGDISLQSLRSSTSFEFGNRGRSSDIDLPPSRTSGLRREQDSTSATQDANVDLREPGSDVKPSLPAHALSLLLTCRKVSQEATILAFNTHTFTLTPSKSTTFFDLHQSTAHLSPEQFSVITFLALDLTLDHTNPCPKASDFLSNAMLLFPTVQRLTIRIQKSKLAIQQSHTPEVWTTPHSEGPIRDNALKRYVPNWLRDTLQHVVDGRSFSWQRGHKWRVEWPQFESPVYVQSMEYVNLTESWQMMGSMPVEAAGVVDGAEICMCGCGALRWLAANLVQETGRKVEVGVVYYGDIEAEELRKMKLKLEPLKEGEDPLPVTWLQGGDAAVWEADEEYWNGLRANSGNYMTVLKLRTWQLWGSSESA